MRCRMVVTLNRTCQLAVVDKLQQQPLRSKANRQFPSYTTGRDSLEDKTTQLPCSGDDVRVIIQTVETYTYPRNLCYEYEKSSPSM